MAAIGHAGSAFVRFFLNLSAKSKGTFENFSTVLPNFQISRGLKSGRFLGGKIAGFANSCHTATYKREPPLTPPKGELGLPARPLRLCNGAAIALQRAPRCNMTGTPLQPREGPVARRRPLFCPFPDVKNSRSFVVLKSRKALPASQDPPLGESEGAVVGAVGTL